jgi:surfeit locus 1 family protein
MLKRSLTITLILGAFCTLIALGTWQVQRLAWKENLIAQATERPTLPAIPLEQLLASDEQGLAYRRVRVSGEFFGDPVRVFTTLSDANGIYEGPGYWLMHPFQLAATGQNLFVNRGFIPFEMPPGSKVNEAPVGPVRFDGLVRPSNPADWATPDPDFETNLVYRRDVAQLRRAADLSSALPVTVDMPARVTGGLPQAGETKFTFSNRHLEYAVTWYGLAAVLVIIVGVSWWRRRA